MDSDPTTDDQSSDRNQPVDGTLPLIDVGSDPKAPNRSSSDRSRDQVLPDGTVSSTSERAELAPKRSDESSKLSGGRRKRTRRRGAESRGAASPTGAGPQSDRTDDGIELERRIARVEFAEGAFVRLRVPVRADAESGREILTDIDVLSIEIDLRLRITRTMLECKSGKGQAGEPDRLFWLAGFRQYVGAQRAGLVRVTASRRGLALARALGLHVIDNTVLAAREAANAWLPNRFAHIGGSGCQFAEQRTDIQLKGLVHLPKSLTNFLRYETLLAEPHRILGALVALRGAVAQGALPDPTGTVLAGHALIGLLLAAIGDAVLLDTVRPDDLRRRLERSLTTGDPDDDHVLHVLGDADQLMRYAVEQVHEKYGAMGVARQEVPVPNLRELVAEPPAWLDSYLDLIERLRANPTVVRGLVQTAEVACFDALAGDHAWEAEAFSHLFTPEHQQLLLTAVRTLRAIVGDTVGDRLQSLADLPFDRMPPPLPDRRHSSSRIDSPAPKLAKQADDS